MMTKTSLDQAISEYLSSFNPEDRQTEIRSLKTLISSFSDKKHNPVDNVIWVNYNMVEANDYNPNAVAKREMKLLHTSIIHDGYTQPIVTIWDEQKQKYVIIDGFHRYASMVYNQDLRDLNNSMVPIVVLDKDINERMASTIRHNRARGKHSVEGMSNIILRMLKNGESDEDICNELGLESEELVRYKYVTGFAKLYENKDFGHAWETTNQIDLRNKYKKEHPDEETFK